MFVSLVHGEKKYMNLKKGSENVKSSGPQDFPPGYYPCVSSISVSTQIDSAKTQVPAGKWRRKEV